MTRQQVDQINQQSKGYTPLINGILKRIAIRAVSDQEVQSTTDVESATFRESHFHHDFSRVPIHTATAPVIQPKLTIGAVGDKYEETGRVVQEVVQHNRSEVTQQKLENKKRKQSNQTSIPTPVLRKMEDFFEQDFSGVRVHTNSPRALEVGALAYTQGQKVHFAPGYYQPNTLSGQQLLGHELAHVVQQRKGQVKPTMQLNDGAMVNDEEHLEKEADVFGKKASLHESTIQSKSEVEVNYNELQMANTHQDASQLKKSEVMQLIKAYRVGTSKSAYKIVVENGKVVKYDGGSNGIDISFGDPEHAEYYFKTKSTDRGAVLVEWEFPDELYEMIVARVQHKGGKKIPQEWKKGAGKLPQMWDKIEKLPSPTQTSDPVARKLGVIAPHFAVEWIEVFNKYAISKPAKLYTYEEYFPE